MKRLLLFLLAATFGSGATAGMSGAGPTTWQEPPAAIADLLLATAIPTVLLAPGGLTLAILERHERPSIAELAAPTLGLAGLRFDPRSRTPALRNTNIAYKLTDRPPPGHPGPDPRLEGPFATLQLLDLGSGATRSVVGLPAGAGLSLPSWSPDGRFLALAVRFEDRVETWVVEAASVRARPLGGGSLNAIAGAPLAWLPDGRSLVALTVPARLAGPQGERGIPKGPLLRDHVGGKAPARTYQDLLDGPNDEQLFEHYMSAELEILSVDGKPRRIGPTDMLLAAAPSPDGQYLLVTLLERPFSWLVPMNEPVNLNRPRFARRFEVWDLQGRKVASVGHMPLAERLPIGRDSVAPGDREAGWRSDAAAELYLVRAVDGGNAASSDRIRDEVRLLPAPFDGQPRLLAGLAGRFEGVQWGSDATALVWSSWWKSRNRQALMVAPGRPATDPRLLFDFSMQDPAGNPGEPVERTTASGHSVLWLLDDGATILLNGYGASAEGERPFLDRLDPRSMDRERLWQSDPPYYEKIVALVDAGARLALTIRESVKDTPNYHLRDLRDGRLTPLTRWQDPYPALRGVKKELLHYLRADGVPLSAYVYLPADYDPAAGPLPTLLWAYPFEYKDAADAAQVVESIYRFPVLGSRSVVPWVTQGYAVLDRVAMPIISAGQAEANDTFIEQLVANAQAAIEAGVRRGVVDRGRVAALGHSYGAFMTANLLAHTDLFRAGVARSGAYNRTLTPFGFQREERSFWEAPEVYLRMSPFVSASQIEAPLLLIHGTDDSGAATNVMQSERMYSALKGLGKTTRLVLLPHEGHTYLARESILHQAWEIDEWLRKYVMPVPEAKFRPESLSSARQSDCCAGKDPAGRTEPGGAGTGQGQ
jgi:dipeptidyl aminopeptidase/acylaminoacyl peptidase